MEKENVFKWKHYQPGVVCALTGEVSNCNISLSPEGAERLIKEVEQYLVK